ncbi:hypothetical protein BJV78DRAFT_624468 [Lactifluus subvellereus]|nr:hypothetical protein BJV78DRAFT_624468 [Lactifluus subvellereus]
MFLIARRRARQESAMTEFSPDQDQSPDGESPSDAVGRSVSLLRMYMGMVSEEDKVLAKRWADDASEILLFTGLFSAVVAALLVESMKQLKQQSTDVSAFYLQNIYGVLANQSNAPTGVPVIADFPQPSFAVWVNALWFLSLANSLSCALLATIVQLWARQYTEAARSKVDLHDRALLHAFFAQGAEQSRLPLLVDFIPFLLHVSFFTFFAGLFLFLLDLHPTIVRAVYSLVGFYIILYLYATLHPIFRRNNPLHSPLSPLVWSLYTGILSVVLKILKHLTTRRYFSITSWKRLHRWEEGYRRWFQDGIGKAGEDSARTLSSDIFGLALTRTLKSLGEDSGREKFFKGIPEFCNSAYLTNPKGAFKTPHGKEISKTLVGFLHRTLVSDGSLTFKDKELRIEICTQAMDAASLPITRPILERVLYHDWKELLKTVEFGLILSRVNHNHAKTDYRSKCMVAATIATVRERDNRWFELATSQLGHSRPILEYYSEHGDSVLLANCIHICWYMIKAYSENHWNIGADRGLGCLDIVSSFDCGDILPELQREFCQLWNALGVMTKDSTAPRIRPVAMRILKCIRKVYDKLHDTSRPKRRDA